MEHFLARWRLESSDGFDDYMKALGVGFALRKMGNMAKPDIIIKLDGDCVTIRTESTVKTSETKAKLGEEFDEKTVDGRDCKSTIVLEDGKLVHTQNGKKTTVITRSLNEAHDEMTVEMAVDNAKCIRKYKRFADN